MSHTQAAQTPEYAHNTPDVIAVPQSSKMVRSPPPFSRPCTATRQMLWYKRTYAGLCAQTSSMWGPWQSICTTKKRSHTQPASSSSSPQHILWYRSTHAGLCATLPSLMTTIEWRFRQQTVWSPSCGSRHRWRRKTCVVDGCWRAAEMSSRGIGGWPASKNCSTPNKSHSRTSNGHKSVYVGALPY